MKKQSVGLYFWRNLILATLCVLVAPSAIAQTDVERRVMVLGACQNLSELAASVMTLRQLGMPVREAMERAKNDGPASEFTVPMTLEAYEAPQMQTEEGRNILIKDFSSQQYLKCQERFSN